MRSSLAVSVLITGFGLAMLAHSVTAQSAGGTTPGKTPAANVPPATPWSASPVGTYELVVEVEGRPTPATLVVIDSAGKLRATVKTNEDPELHSMDAVVKGLDLILQASTPQGVMNVVLQRHGSEITGAWERNEQHGAITGKQKA